MAKWIAVSFGALDVTANDLGTVVELLVLPIFPGEPRGLVGVGARLWRRLVDDGPIDDADLTDDERNVLAEMREFGIVSNDLDHRSRIRSIKAPWLSSPWHELVYALTASLSQRESVPIVCVKGPVLRRQGLREREHSGDVDVWVLPGTQDRLARVLADWGWDAVPHTFAEETYHSVTLRPRTWGCEIDVHFRFPGIAVSHDRAFQVLWRERDQNEFAGVSCFTPSVTAHSVILALHAIRPKPGVVTTESAHRDAQVALRRGGIDTVRFASDWRAYTALADDFERVFPKDDLPARDGVLAADWASRASGSRAQFHLAIIRGLPWSKRPGALLRALWPPDEAVLRSAAHLGYPDDSPTRARLRRLAHGLRSLLRANKHRENSRTWIRR